MTKSTIPTLPDTSAMPRDFREAVDDLYGAFREARLNVKYYGEKLAWYQKRNTWIEIAIAVGTSSTLLSLPLFSTQYGHLLTGTLGLAAAMLGILKPILNFPEKIEKTSKLWSGYLAAFTTAQSIVRNLKLRKSIDAIDENVVRELHERMDALCAGDDPCPKAHDIDRLQSEVQTQYPTDEFWWPPQSAVA